MKTKPFSELRKRMTPERRAKNEARAQLMLSVFHKPKTNPTCRGTISSCPTTGAALTQHPAKGAN